LRMKLHRDECVFSCKDAQGYDTKCATVGGGTWSVEQLSRRK